mmetsp:Transcript_49617/g.153228  ORF Transcript_49617/g.153228 Transcript_49617/m.153228 type:complete len:477 (-) Transcript_49617:120-1550(-)
MQDLRGALGVVEELGDALDVVDRDHVGAARLRHDLRRREQLHDEAHRRVLADLAELHEGLVVELDALDAGANVDDGGHLVQAVRRRADHQEAVEQVGRDAVRRADVGAADAAHAAVGGEDDDGGERRLERLVQEREAFDVQHVHLIDEQDAGDELRDALVDVLVDDLVDLLPQLLRDLRLLLLHERRHERHGVAALVRARVGGVEVVQGDVLDDLLLLVDVTFGQGHELVCLEVGVRGVGIAAADALDGAGGGLDVDDVADGDLLLLDRLVDGGVELELLRALHALEGEDDVRDGLAVAAERVVGLLSAQLGDLALVHLLVLLDQQADGAAEVLHEHRGLLHLGRVHLGADHGAERDLRAELLGHREGEGGLAGARRAGVEHGAAGHLLGLDELNDDARRLARLRLADKPVGARLAGDALLVQAEALDMAVRRDALAARRGHHLLDLDAGHRWLRGGVAWRVVRYSKGVRVNSQGF